MLLPDSGFDAFWALINKELVFLSLEMRRVNVPPEPRAAPVRYVGIVNKARPPALSPAPVSPLLLQLVDEASKQATRFTPQQVALFRAIVRPSLLLSR